MLIWCVTGLSQARWLKNALDNFSRLRDGARLCGADCRLVLVENGAGSVDMSSPALTHPDVRGLVHVIKSAAGVSEYINAGLAYVRTCAVAGDWFAKIDQDDYYGAPRGKSIVEVANRGARAAGASSLYCYPHDGPLMHSAFPVEDWAPIPWNVVAHGPSMCARVDCALDFPDVDERGWGEDLLWAVAMRTSGAALHALPSAGYCWMRYGATGGHAFPVTDSSIRDLWRGRTVNAGAWSEWTVNAPPDPSWPEIPRDAQRSSALLAGLLRRGITSGNVCAPATRQVAKDGVMSTRQIKVPTALVINAPDGNLVGYTFAAFVSWVIDSAPKFAQNVSMLATGVRIINAVNTPTTGADGEVITLDAADWQLLRDAVEKPHDGKWPLSPPRVLLPFCEAIVNA